MMTEKEKLISELVCMLSGRSVNEISRILTLVKDYLSLVDENRSAPG